ncbi:efflux RND transporter periplasmic adaptor subunit [Rufibacter quisquiliarum]|uniref:Membrane fusion protein (Multidrug efflux system) n=1 Tax=Rufibacter quisquiliarum TaxID=1549639 RepID=A0A839GMQ6_9BACT|nr:efflux RND transporter periplasmic adaptor subunit [Rufibacter quisquiliarum]MBA9075718.1 membrane fusion protein (multidrug efflux system) [Rufibacter quisquiliarum]
MKIKHIVYALLVVGLGALVYYRISSNKEQAGGGPGGGGRGPGGPGGPGGAPAMRVSGVVLAPRQFANSLSVTGSIEANEQVEIRSQVSGLVRSINFQEGSNVRKGQVLLKIDDSELRAQLSQAQTRRNLAAENAQRAKLLLEKEAISREEYDIASADLRTAQAQIQLIQAQMAKTSVVAPFSGKVGLRNISMGSYLSPETVVTTLVSSDPVKITFAVPEKYAGQVKQNAELTFTVAGSQDKFKAKVYAIEPNIEASTRTLQLRAKAANPNGTLLPGSFANVQLPLAVIEGALLVPTEAVIPIQNGKKVFIAEGGKAKEVMIETSTRTEDDLLVTSGLNPGDTVLTTGVLSLKPGSPVRIALAKQKN